MTALMYKKPTDHLEFLQSCLDKAKDQRKVHWHTFIDPLPPIPKAAGPIVSEKAAPLTPRPPSAPKKPATPTLAKGKCGILVSQWDFMSFMVSVGELKSFNE